MNFFDDFDQRAPQYYWQVQMQSLPRCFLLSSFAGFESIETPPYSILTKLEHFHGLHGSVHLLDALVGLERLHILP